MSDILVERTGPTAVITLNRPQAMNALSSALRAEFAALVRSLDADGTVAVMVLTGADDRAFCAGMDLKELGSDTSAIVGANGATPELNPVKALELFRKPVIAAVNGVAAAGGFELALAADVLIASSRARFADTHLRVGVLPGWGLSQRLSRLIGPYRAKELSLTGNFLDAETACAWGLVNRVVAPEALMETSLALARQMADTPPSLLIDMKRLIDGGYALTYADGLAFETDLSTTRNSRLAAADVEANRAAVLKRGRAQG